MSGISTVDLDGTLITVNSFPLWIRHLLRSSLRHGRPGRAGRLLAWSVQRRCGKLSHSEYKRRIMSLPIAPAEIDEFCERLTEFVDPTVHAAVTADAQPVLVATAAPASYAVPFARRLGLRLLDVLASDEEVTGTWNDNVGAAKLASVQRRLEGLAHSPHVLFTDHADDVPLATWCERTVICNADDVSYRALSEASPDAVSLYADRWAQPIGRRGYVRLDLSSEFALDAAATELLRRCEASRGPVDLLVGVVTGGDEVCRRILRRRRIPYLALRCQRSETSTKRRIGIHRLLPLLPDGLSWALRRLENAFREARHRGRGPSPDRRTVEVVARPDGDPVVRRILLVDDAVDSGATLLATRDHVRATYPDAELVTASLTVAFAEPWFRPDLSLADRALLRGPWSLDARRSPARRER